MTPSSRRPGQFGESTWRERYDQCEPATLGTCRPLGGATAQRLRPLQPARTTTQLGSIASASCCIDSTVPPDSAMLSCKGQGSTSWTEAGRRGRSDGEAAVDAAAGGLRPPPHRHGVRRRQYCPKCLDHFTLRHGGGANRSRWKTGGSLNLQPLTTCRWRGAG